MNNKKSGNSNKGLRKNAKVKRVSPNKPKIIPPKPHPKPKK